MSQWIKVFKILTVDSIREWWDLTGSHLGRVRILNPLALELSIYGLAHHLRKILIFCSN